MRLKLLLLSLFLISCDNNNSVESPDCASVSGGDAVVDDCGICTGIDGYVAGSCYDCANTPNGSAVEDCAGVCGGETSQEVCDECLSLVFDCAGVCDGAAVVGGCDNECGSNLVEDACGECGGDANSADECPDESCGFEVCISIININSNSLDIGMINSASVAGFQFNINGITITTASGGVTEENGLSVSTSSNMILSFSMSGASIPAGNNELTHIEFTDNSSTICLANPVFSSQSGEKLSVSLGDFECD